MYIQLLLNYYSPKMELKTKTNRNLDETFHPSPTPIFYFFVIVR